MYPSYVHDPNCLNEGKKREKLVIYIKTKTKINKDLYLMFNKSIQTFMRHVCSSNGKYSTSISQNDFCKNRTKN